MAAATRSSIHTGHAAIHRDEELRRLSARRARTFDILTCTSLWIGIGVVVAVVVRLG